jgi:light-harvesting complex 1 beta chain
MASNEKTASPTGLADTEAQEVHGWMVRSFIAYILFAIVAHSLMWMWKPWIGPASERQSSMTDHTTQLVYS